jgi:hypothetical protein
MNPGQLETGHKLDKQDRLVSALKWCHKGAKGVKE